MQSFLIFFRDFILDCVIACLYQTFIKVLSCMVDFQNILIFISLNVYTIFLDLLFSGENSGNFEI